MIWNRTCQTSNFLILCFELNFAIFCGFIRVKSRLYTFKMRSPECSDYSNNKQNQYSTSIYERYLEPYHDHCFSRTYFQNKMKTQRPGLSFVCFKNVLVLSISEYFFSISVFPKFVVNLLITFAVGKIGTWRELCNVLWSKNYSKHRGKFVPPACNVIL